MRTEKERTEWIRRKLPENPSSALNVLWSKKRIPKPVYVHELSRSGPWVALVEVKGWGHAVSEAPFKGEASRKAAEELLMAILARLCPTPHKKRYATWESGHLVMERLASTGTHEIQQVYLCRCGWWHLSSKSYGIEDDE